MYKRKIKCRFCEWQVNSFIYNHKTKQRRSGMLILREHIEQRHPKEAEMIYADDFESNFPEDHK